MNRFAKNSKWCKFLIKTRECIGWNRFDFCAYYEFNYDWYCKIERGDIYWRNLTIKNFSRLADAFGYSLDRFYELLSDAE